MDPLTLLLVVVFFVLPLLQQIAERRRKQGRPPLPPRSELPDVDEAAHDDAPHVHLERGESGSWSVDWGAWPTESPSAPAEPEEADTYDDVYGGHETLPARYEAPPPPESVRAEPSPPVFVQRDRASRSVSLESLDVDRAAEHARLHRRLAERAPQSVASPRRRAPSSLGRQLLVPSEARRAMLLAEVLAPPRALRPPDA